MTKRIRSRIHQFLPLPAQEELMRICKSSIVSDNNAKVPAMLAVLDKYGIEYVELGPGTNRLAVLIDNYVFKIALDKWGLRDNKNEFIMSAELQPYVAKTYENNELISVHEYVTVISRDEFIEKREEILDILYELAQSYLVGDIGTIPKNFCNWGYRDNGELVALDFAYVFRVKGDELLCSEDQEILEYDENYHFLICPHCKRKYSFMDIRRRISIEEEDREYEMATEFAYVATKDIQEVGERYTEGESNGSTSLYNQDSRYQEEENQMAKNNGFGPFDDVFEDENEAYLRALEQIHANKEPEPEDHLTDEELKTLENHAKAMVEQNQKEPISIIDVHQHTEEGSSHVHIVHSGSQDRVSELVNDIVQEIETNTNEAVNELQRMQKEQIVQGDLYTPSEEEQQATVSEVNELNLEAGNEFVNESYSEEDGVVTYEREEAHVTETGFVAERQYEVSDESHLSAEHDLIEADADTVHVEHHESEITTIIRDDADEPAVEEEEENQFTLPPYTVSDQPQGLTVIEPKKESDGIVVAEVNEEIRLSDSVTIENSVRIKASDEDKAEQLRQQLMDGQDETSATEELVEEDPFEYLYEQNALENSRRGGKKSWV